MHWRLKQRLQWIISVIQRLYRNKNSENEGHEKYLEAEEDIDEDELEYLEEDIQVDDYNPVNEEQDALIQEYQEDI